MRGGTATCTVTIADEEIGSPLVRNPQAVIAMNLPSLEKYEPLVRPGGVLAVNASMANRTAVRTDITSVGLPANEMAESLGNRRLTNMITLRAPLARPP